MHLSQFNQNTEDKCGHSKFLLENCYSCLHVVWMLLITHTYGAVALIRAIPTVYDAVTSLLKWKTGSVVATVEMGCQIAC